MLSPKNKKKMQEILTMATPNPLTVRQDFDRTYRKEWKYVIPVEEYLKIKPELEKILRPDWHGNEGQYRVRTLYFDSIRDRDLHDNLDGIQHKRKIRLRIYPPGEEWGKLEVKYKNGSDGIKYAVTVNRAEMEAIVQGNYGCLKEKEEACAWQIYLQMMAGGYQPRTIVEYWRTAYLYPVSDTRITFDTRIRGSATGKGFLTDSASFYPLLPDSLGILEIKYNQFITEPIKQLMQRMDRLQTSSSKYTNARMGGTL